MAYGQFVYFLIVEANGEELSIVPGTLIISGNLHSQFNCRLKPARLLRSLYLAKSLK
jgi:hypothetical protein